MPARQTAAARRMRKKPPETERFLWRLLRGRRLEQLKFRRQFPFGPYILDFVCLHHRLVVEADGYWHDPVADAERDRWLVGEGFRVLRFDNGDIVGRTELVLAAIVAATQPRDDPTEAPLVTSARTLRGPGRRVSR